MDKLYLAAVTIFGIGWYIEQRMLSIALESVHLLR